MAVQMVPVGLSLLGKRRDQGLPEPPVVDVPSLAESGAFDPTGVAEAVDALCPAEFPAESSAELTTLERCFAESGATLPLPRRYPAEDTIILISSDTRDGHRAALWNALALTGGDPHRVRRLADPDALAKAAPLLVPGLVVIVALPGLDTAGRAPFTEAMIHLGRLGRGLLSSPAGRGADYVFHLSGGYKATIPYLVGLAEGMLGLREREEVASVHADVLHDADRSRLIDIPLRALPYRLVLRELGSARQDPATGGYMVPYDPDDPLLEGYAYRRDGAVYRLTPFGEGLLRLTGLAGAE